MKTAAANSHFNFCLVNVHYHLQVYGQYEFFYVFKKSILCSPRLQLFDVDEFVSSSDLKKCSIPSLAHQWILCSEWVPSE